MENRRPGDPVKGSTQIKANTSRQPYRLASLGCGLTYGLAYALTVWGFDARILARSNCELAGAKLAAGLPLLVLIGAATGALAGRSERAGAWVRTWMASGSLIGITAGLMPYAGLNLATWIAEPRLWGANVYPLGPGGAARMAFAAAFTGCAGSAAGLAGHVLVERARGLASPTGQVSGRSWQMLVLCLPLAMLPAAISDEIVNRPLHAGQQAVYRAISTSPSGETDPKGVASYRDLLPAGYRLYRTGYDAETMEQQTIDVAFENGVAVRCQVSGQTLAGCLTISSEFEEWMDALVSGAVTGERATEPASQAGRVSVSETTWDWLASQRSAMSGRYEISRDTQRGGWVIMAARFDTGYVLDCTFRGTSPVVLDHCSGNKDRN